VINHFGEQRSVGWTWFRWPKPSLLLPVLRLVAGVALGIGLAACAGGPVTQTNPLTEVRLEQAAVVGADGTRLFLRHWPAEGATRAVILGLHGYGDTAEGTFQWAAKAWAKRGITTYGYDQRGFGRNPDRKQWAGADRLISDAGAVVSAIRAQHPDLPVVVVGQSMGGGVALAAAANPDFEADGLVLAAPAIAGGTQVSPVYRLGGYAIALLYPDRRFTGERLPETVELQPTDDIERLRAVIFNTGHFADPARRDLYGLIRLMDRAAAAAPKVTVPTLTVMGAVDDYLRPRAVFKIHNTVPGKTEFRLYPKGFHWILRDQQSPAVWADIGDFVLGISSE